MNLREISREVIYGEGINNLPIVAKPCWEVGEYLAVRPFAESTELRTPQASTPGGPKVLRYQGLLRNVQCVKSDTTTAFEHNRQGRLHKESPEVQDQKTLAQGMTQPTHLIRMYNY